MATTNYQAERKNILLTDLALNKGNILKQIGSCKSYLKDFPADVEVLYYDADFTCQRALTEEGERRLALLQEGVTKLELLCTDATVGSFAQMYMKQVNMMIGQENNVVPQKLDSYKKVDTPTALLWCAYLHAQQNDFEQAQKFVEAYTLTTKSVDSSALNSVSNSVFSLDECFAFPEVKVKSVQQTQVLWQDPKDYRKNMVLLGLLMQNHEFNTLTEVQKDAFLSALNFVYTTMPTPSDKEGDTVLIQDKLMLKTVLTTLYHEQARKNTGDIVKKDKYYSALLAVDNSDLESLLYFGDKAVRELDWKSISKHYSAIYSLVTSPELLSLKNTLFYDQSRISWMLYAIFKTGSSLDKESSSNQKKYELIKQEAEKTNEEELYGFLLKLYSTLEQDVDLRSVKKREEYFGFEPLSTFSQLSFCHPDNSFYTEIVAEMKILSEKKPKSSKKWWKL